MRRCLAGPYGKKVLFFDGVDDYVECPSPQLTEWTILALCKPTEFMDSMVWGRLVSIGVSENAINLGISISNDRSPFGQIKDTSGNSWLIKSPYKYTPNVWQVWVFTFKRPVAKLYHNASLVAEKEFDVDVREYSSPTRIGWRVESTIERFKGLIEVVYVYNIELQDKEIKRIVNDAFNLRPASIRNGLVLELIPDTLDCEAGKWYDNSGHGNHGTIYGARCVYV